jgi:hypothetical protein
MEHDDATLSRWLEAAKARHRHVPKGPERDRLVAITLREIQYEAELLTFKLPDLTDAQRTVLLEEACAELTAREGVPLDDLAEELQDARIDALFARLCLRAREQMAGPDVRAKLITRRLQRRWVGA